MTTTWRRAACGALVVLGLAAVATRVHAQAAPIWNPSVRAEGMGGASAGVAWGDPNAWGNVASIARVEGFRWDQARMSYQFYSNDVRIRFDQLVVGHGGIAIATCGVPPGLGRNRTEASWPIGMAPAVVSSLREPSVRLAVSVPRAVATMRGSTPSEAYDVALGIARSRWIEQYTETWVYGPTNTRDEASAWSFGLQGRISPLRFAADHGARPPVSWDVGAGAALLDAPSSKMHGTGAVTSRPLAGLHLGVATRGVLPMPALAGDSPRDRYLASTLPHLVSLGVAYDHERMFDPPSGHAVWFRDLVGAELSIADVIVLRTGHVWDSSDLKGWTTGWGVGLPLGPWGGFRYDHAKIPFWTTVAGGHVTRTGWSAWCDPLRIWRDTGRSSAETR